MPRDIRYIPPDSLVELTNRTVEGRFLMAPDREVNEIIRGVLAKAAHVHRMRVVAFVWMSTPSRPPLPGDPLGYDRLEELLPPADCAGEEWMDRLFLRRQGDHRDVAADRPTGCLTGVDTRLTIQPC